MRIAICDDEEKSRGTVIEYLKPYLKEGLYFVYNEFENGESLLESHKVQPFDIIFLDIEMDALSGMEAAEALHKLGNSPIIIFITNHVSYISEALRVDAFQFLVKPITKQDFDVDFNRAREKYKINHYLYTVRYREFNLAIEVKDIEYIEISKRHLLLHTNGSEQKFNGKLSDEAKKLRSYNFVLCHQSYLVNMRYIKRIKQEKTDTRQRHKGARIELKSGKEIPVSKHRLTEVMSRFNDFLSRYSV